MSDELLLEIRDEVRELKKLLTAHRTDSSTIIRVKEAAGMAKLHRETIISNIRAGAYGRVAGGKSGRPFGINFARFKHYHGIQ